MLEILFPAGKQCTDLSGRPLDEGTVSIYISGQQTRASIYSDTAYTPMSNPWPLQLGGRFNCYVENGYEYDIIVKDASGAVIDQDLNVQPGGYVDPSQMTEWMDQVTIQGNGVSDKFHVVAESIADGVTIEGKDGNKIGVKMDGLAAELADGETIVANGPKLTVDQTWIEQQIKNNSIDEAPIDGHIYGRRDEAWTQIEIPQTGITDVKSEAGKTFVDGTIATIPNYSTGNPGLMTDEVADTIGKVKDIQDSAGTSILNTITGIATLRDFDKNGTESGQFTKEIYDELKDDGTGITQVINSDGKRLDSGSTATLIPFIPLNLSDSSAMMSNTAAAVFKVSGDYSYRNFTVSANGALALTCSNETLAIGGQPVFANNAWQDSFTITAQGLSTEYTITWTKGTNGGKIKITGADGLPITWTPQTIPLAEGLFQYSATDTQEGTMTQEWWDDLIQTAGKVKDVVDSDGDSIVDPVTGVAQLPEIPTPDYPVVDVQDHSGTSIVDPQTKVATLPDISITDVKNSSGESLLDASTKTATLKKFKAKTNTTSAVEGNMTQPVYETLTNQVIGVRDGSGTNLVDVNSKIATIPNYTAGSHNPGLLTEEVYTYFSNNAYNAPVKLDNQVTITSSGMNINFTTVYPPYNRFRITGRIDVLFDGNRFDLYIEINSIPSQLVNVSQSFIHYTAVNIVGETDTEMEDTIQRLTAQSYTIPEISALVAEYGEATIIQTDFTFESLREESSVNGDPILLSYTLPTSAYAELNRNARGISYPNRTIDLYIDNVLTATLLNSAIKTDYTMPAGTHIVRIQPRNENYNYGWALGLELNDQMTFPSGEHGITAIINLPMKAFMDDASHLGVKAFQSQFYECSKLNYCPNLIIPEGVEYIGLAAFDSMFGRAGLEVYPEIVLPESIKQIDGSAFQGMFARTFGKSAPDLHLPARIYSEGALGSSLFYQMYYLCSKLEVPPKITMPSQVALPSPTSGSTYTNMFKEFVRGCSKLPADYSVGFIDPVFKNYPSDVNNIFSSSWYMTKYADTAGRRVRYTDGTEAAGFGYNGT
jgi:hypothetical protein